MNRESVHLDTNIILRLLLGDIQKQKKIAIELLENSKCKVSDVALAEVVFVLERYYKLDRPDIKLALRALGRIDNISFNQDLLEVALRSYNNLPKLSLEDCLLAAQASIEDSILVTFDKNLASKIDNVELLK